MQQEKTIYSVLIGLIVLSIVFLIVERVIGRGRKQPVFRRGWFTDVIYWVITPFFTKQLVKYGIILPAGLLVLAKVTTVEGFQLRTYNGFGPLGAQPLWLQALEIYVLVDFIGYWTHRLFHGGRLWPFHAVHHSSEDLDWLGSVRVHPVNDLVNKMAQAAPLILLGFNPYVTLSTAPFFTLYAIFLHANVNWDFGPLRSVIATPVFHRWHHSKDREAWDKNFAGLFPFWDILFGTYYMPKGRYPENFGIHDPMPKGFFGQMWAPFVWKRSKAADAVKG
jgi:sterol desaturase/sphingolipid hydroxylase (fatty acid hydroxylase superfamily)